MISECIYTVNKGENAHILATSTKLYMYLLAYNQIHHISIRKPQAINKYHNI